METQGRQDMKDWVAKVVVALAVCLGLSGCSHALSDIRGSEPFQTVTSSQQPFELAKCIAMRIQAHTARYWCEDSPAVAFEEYPNHTYRVVLLVPPPGPRGDIFVKPISMGTVVESRRITKEWAGDEAIGDILVKPASGETLVEFRRITRRWSGDSVVPEIIEGCAKRGIEGKSPPLGQAGKE
jgi:uncharacterized protein YceK